MSADQRHASRKSEINASKQLSRCDLPSERGVAEDDVYRILVSPQTFKGRKPTSAEYASVRASLSDERARKRATLDDICRYLSQGHVIMFGDFAGGTCTDNWVSQRLFAVDFDNDDAVVSRGYDVLEPLEALCIAANAGISTVILYFTMSAKIAPYRPRYRMVVDAGTRFTERERAQSFLDNLVGLFPEADPASSRLAQMYLSGGGELWPIYRMSRQG